MQKINKVKIFYNSNDVSQKVYRTLVKKLVDSGLEIV